MSGGQEFGSNMSPQTGGGNIGGKPREIRSHEMTANAETGGGGKDKVME